MFDKKNYDVKLDLIEYFNDAFIETKDIPFLLWNNLNGNTVDKNAVNFSREEIKKIYQTSIEDNTDFNMGMFQLANILNENEKYHFGTLEYMFKSFEWKQMTGAHKQKTGCVFDDIDKGIENYKILKEDRRSLTVEYFEHKYFSLLLSMDHGSYIKVNNKISEVISINPWFISSLNNANNSSLLASTFVSRNYTEKELEFLQVNYIRPDALAFFLEPTDFAQVLTHFEKQMKKNQIKEYVIGRAENTYSYFTTEPTIHANILKQCRSATLPFYTQANIKTKTESGVITSTNQQYWIDNFKYWYDNKKNNTVFVKKFMKELVFTGVVPAPARKVRDEVFEISVDDRKYKNIIFETSLKKSHTRFVSETVEFLNQELIERTSKKITVHFKSSIGQQDKDKFIFNIDERVIGNDEDFSNCLINFVKEIFKLDIHSYKTQWKNIELNFPSLKVLEEKMSENLELSKITRKKLGIK